MKKFLRRLLIVVLVLLVAAIAVPLFVRHRVYTKPTWYPQRRLSAADQAAAANRADQKMIAARSEIAGLYAEQTRATRGATGPSTLPAGQYTLEFTDDEINSWLPKWKDELSWGGRVDALMTDPQIVFHDGQIILAATIRKWDTIVSLHFLPRIEQGKLRLTLTDVMAGTLPLPKVSWSMYEDKLVEGVENRLPKLQQNADIDPHGRANAAAVSAAMAELLLHSLRNEPAEPVLFIPDQLSRNGRSLPVKITDVTVVAGVLDITVRPMDGAERQALLQILRGSSSNAQ